VTPHICYYAKFGRCRSNGTRVLYWQVRQIRPKMGPSRPAFSRSLKVAVGLTVSMIDRGQSSDGSGHNKIDCYSLKCNLLYTIELHCVLNGPSALAEVCALQVLRVSLFCKIQIQTMYLKYKYKIPCKFKIHPCILIHISNTVDEIGLIFITWPTVHEKAQGQKVVGYKLQAVNWAHAKFRSLRCNKLCSWFRIKHATVSVTERECGSGSYSASN